MLIDGHGMLYQIISSQGNLPQSEEIESSLQNIDDWYTGLNSHIKLGIAVVDLKKAFDTVDCRVLCDKRKLYEFNRGNSPGSKLTPAT